MKVTVSEKKCSICSAKHTLEELNIPAIVRGICTCNYKDKKPFPKLMISKDQKEISLFLSEEEAVMLISEEFIEFNFNPDWNIAEFEDFEGTVTLEND